MIVKLFLDEEYSQKAFEIKDSYLAEKVEILLPSLIIYELINTLKFKKFKQIELEEAVKAIRKYGFELHDVDELENKAIEAISYYDITAYDAAYVALAALNNAVLYTADEKLLKSLKESHALQNT